MADYTYEQVITALQNADKAGDVDAAKQLAQLASTLTPTPPEVATPAAQTNTESLGKGAGLAARALTTGASALPNAVLDFMSGAYNLGAMGLGSSSRMPTMSAEQQQAMTQLGLPVPTTTLEKAVSGGLEALTGGGVQAGLAAASKVPAAASMLQNLPTQLAAQTAGGAAAAPSYEGIKTLTGSDLAATIGSLGMSVAAAGITGGAMNAIGKPTTPKITMEDVTKRAQRAYTAMEDSGVAVKPQSALNMVDALRSRVDDAGFVPENTPKVANLLKKYQDIIGTQRVPFTTLETMRKMANNLKGDENKDTARLAAQVVSGIDDYLATMSGRDIMANQGKLDEAVKNVMSARKDWATQSRATILDDILTKANIAADNPSVSESEKIRQGFINLAQNKSKFNQFSSDEQAAIRRVAQGGSFDAVLTQLGKFNPERSKLVTGAAGYGVASGNPLILGAAGAGYAADTLQKYMRQSAAKKTIQNLLGGVTPAPVSQYPFMGLLSAPIQQ